MALAESGSLAGLFVQSLCLSMLADNVSIEIALAASLGMMAQPYHMQAGPSGLPSFDLACGKNTHLIG